MSMQRIGGWSAIVIALAYVAGMILTFTLLDSTGIVEPLARTAFAVEHSAALSAFILFLYVGLGCLFVVVSLALHERQKSSARNLSMVGTVFALIWSALLIGSGLVYNIGLAAVCKLHAQDPSSAAQLMAAVEVVHQGLGCTIEVPGGLWILLASLASFRSRILSPAWSVVGSVAGVAGLLSLVPPLFLPSVAIYALLSVAWYIRVGWTLLRAS
jgi:hypothetical protein